MAERPTVRGTRATVGGRQSVTGTRRTVRAGDPVNVGKPKKKDGGSLLGNLAHETYSAISGLPDVPGVVGGALAHDVHKVFEAPLRNSSIWNYATGGKQPHSDVWEKLLHPAISNAWWHVDPLIHGDIGKTYGRIKEDPLNPIIDVAAIFTGGAARGLAASDARALNIAMKATDESAAAAKARIAKAIVTGRYQREPGEITVQGSHGLTIPTRQLPRNAYRATRMQINDAMLKKLPPETAVFGEFARAARKVKTNSVRRQLANLADQRYETYSRAWSKLDKYQRVAVSLLARVPLRKDLDAWVAKLPDDAIGNETRALVSDPRVLEAYMTPDEKVAAANEAARAVSHARENILRQTTPIKDETLNDAPYRHTRAARGAEYVTPTPGRQGVASPALLSARGRVAKLQKQVDLLTARTSGTGKWKGRWLPDRPRTLDEAQAHLDQLEAAHSAGLEKIRQAWFGKSDKSDVAFRNRENKKAARQREGVTRAGKRSGASGAKATTRKTFVQETRDLTMQRLEEMQRQHPDHPVVKAWFKRADEIGQLQDAINMSKLGPEPPRLFPEAPAPARNQAKIDEIQGKLDQIKAIDEEPFKPSMMHATKDDVYGSLVSSAGREIKWSKFPDKRAAVMDFWTRALEREKARGGPVTPAPGLGAAGETPAKVSAPFGMMTEKPPPGAVPLRGEWTQVERRRIGHIFEPSNREFDVEGEIKGLNKQIRDLQKTLPADSPEVMDWIKQQTAWQKINLLARNMGGVAQAMREHGGSLTSATKIPSREEIAAIVGDLKQRIYDSRASSRDIRNAVNELSRVLEELRKERKRLNTGSRQLPSGQVITATGDILHPRGYQKLQRLSAGLSVAKEQLQQAESRAANRIEATGLVGGGTPEEIRAEIEAAGRPQPYYTPDMPLSDKKLQAPGTGASGLTPRRLLGDIHQSELTRFNMGMLALHPDVIGPSYLRAVAHDYYLDLHANALKLARPFAEGEALPPGYSYVREMAGQKIPHTASARGEQRAAIAEAFPDISEYPSLTLKQGEKASEVARDAEGRLMAIPDRFASTLLAEQKKSATGIRLFASRITSVWRSLVLHLRIPWLENNVIGNALLWTIRFAGIDGLKAVLGMVGETKGVGKVRQLLGSAETRNHLTADDVRQLAPEQHRGTFIQTQLPATKLGRRLDERGGLVRKIHQFGPQTWLPAVDRVTEQAARRSALETVLRGSPEVQRIYHSLEPDTRTMREAMRRGLQNPKVRDLATREVNDALGDFLSLSPVERHAIRGVFPFYAWYREITRIALKLPLDHPGRTAIMLQLGQIAQQQLDDRLGPLPTYLRGVIPLGPARGDKQGILNLNAANPFSTELQLGLGAGALAGIGPHQRAGAQNLLGTVNPFMMTAADYLTRLKAGTAPTGPGGLGRYFYSNFLKGLPEVRPITARPSPLYPGRTQGDLWRQFFGLPTTDISRIQAAKYAREGR